LLAASKLATAGCADPINEVLSKTTTEIIFNMNNLLNLVPNPIYHTIRP
jgi:hypothetical protein